MARRRPLRYRGLSDARIRQLEPVARFFRRLVRWFVLREEYRDDLR
ncbi:MAG: hypothetical protein ACJ768_17950 [Gaiellaceae bacterium]